MLASCMRLNDERTDSADDTSAHTRGSPAVPGFTLGTGMYGAPRAQLIAIGWEDMDSCKTCCCCEPSLIMTACAIKYFVENSIPCRYCGAVLPRSLVFSRSEAGKPALHWEGAAVRVGLGPSLQFNISHTGSLLGGNTSC